ncbi:MAG TPA: hypothetical protein VF624_05710 [Tepidisphaeraceae bacterium]|jgi:hypothetical protein
MRNPSFSVVCRLAAWITVAATATAAQAQNAPATQPAPVPWAPPILPAIDPATPLPAVVSVEATEKQLNTVVPQIRYQGARLAEALDHLSKIGGVPLRIEWPVLNEAGLTADSAVSTRLRNVRFDRVLRTALENARPHPQGAAAPENAPMHVALPDGRVLVSTRRDVFDRFASTKKYDVRDLFAGDQAGGMPRAELQQQIRDLIVETISADSWAAGLGTIGGTITFDGDTMIVRQTEQVHRPIKELIDALRSANPPRP